MMVMAMTIAATSQPKAIQAPPNRIQIMLRRMDTGCMRTLSSARDGMRFIRPGARKRGQAAGVHYAERRDGRDFRPFSRAISDSIVSAEVTRFLPRRFAA